MLQKEHSRFIRNKIERLEKGGVIWFSGLAGNGKSFLAEALYEKLRTKFRSAIYLDGNELGKLLGYFSHNKASRLEVLFGRSKFARFLSKQNMSVVVSAISIWDEIHELNCKHLENYFKIYIKCDFEELKRRDKKGLCSGALSGETQNVVGVDIPFKEPKPHLIIDNNKLNKVDEKVKLILNALGFKD